MLPHGPSPLPLGCIPFRAVTSSPQRIRPQSEFNYRSTHTPIGLYEDGAIVVRTASWELYVTQRDARLSLVRRAIEVTHWQLVEIGVDLYPFDQSSPFAEHGRFLHRLRITPRKNGALVGIPPLSSPSVVVDIVLYCTRTPPQPAARLPS